MALGAALVDRARLIEKVASDVKVNGRTTFTEVRTAWFRARLTLPRSPETVGPSGAYKRVEMRPTLLYGPRDSEHNPVVVTTEKVIEVDSPELGRLFYMIDADPEPLRKKRRVIGYEAPLKRVEEHPFEPATDPVPVSASTAMQVEAR